MLVIFSSVQACPCAFYTCSTSTLYLFKILGNFLLGQVRIRLRALLWHDLVTSMAVASNPESSEEQVPHNSLLINMTVHFCTKNRVVTRVKSRE